VNAEDLDRYRQLLRAKRREIEAGAIGTIGVAGGPGERQADVIDQASDAAQTDLQVHLHQTDSRLLRAIEEALERDDREFAQALEEVTGREQALREGFRGFDDHREGGYDFRDLQKVAQRMDSSTVIAQQVLERAAKSLPKE
jgi:RNA polymerase-binding transcription factor DksA